MPSKQETFDTVVAHLRKQNRKSENEKFCLYRGENGDKCAAGCLIPDDKYDHSFEEKAIYEQNRYRDDYLQLTEVGRLLEELDHDTRLVESLQRVHDSMHVENWEQGFQEVAVQFGVIHSSPT